MRRVALRAVGSTLACALAACESTSPGAKDLAEFIIDFCSDETPDWVAFQNDGAPWTRVMPNAGGTVTMQVTPRFAFAVSDEDESGPFTDVVYGTRDEFSALNGRTCNEQFGAKVLNGAVGGLAGSQTAEITMAFSFDFVPSGAPQFQLLDLPDRPLDLVAARKPTATALPDRFIVRRAVSFTSGASLAPALDFGAAPPASEPAAINNLSVTGLVAGETNFASVLFRTATGTEHLVREISFASAPQSVAYVPAVLSQSGDFHETFVLAVSSATPTARGVTQFHRLPGDKVAALGSTLNTPIVTNASPTPTPLLRAELTAQADYGGFASVDFFQSVSGTDRHFSVTETSGFHGGTPATWSLEMPDLAGVTAFPPDAVFVSGAVNDWFIEAGSAGADVFAGGVADDVEGLLVKFADRASALPMMLSRTPDALVQRRSPLLRALRPRR